MTTMKRLFLIVLFSTIIVSCSTQKHVEHSNVDNDSRKIEYVHDTLTNFVHDSIYQEVIKAGDTVFFTKYVERTRWREKIVERTDTVTEYKMRTERVETIIEDKVTPKWAYFSLFISIICLIYLAYRTVKLVRKW